MWWRTALKKAYDNFFTSEAMKAATATGIVAAGINITGAHLGAYLVGRSKLSGELDTVQERHRKIVEEKDKVTRDLEIENGKLKDIIQSQKQKLMALSWKSAARKEAIETLPFFLRPTVRRLPAQLMKSHSSESLPDPVEIEHPTIK